MIRNRVIPITWGLQHRTLSYTKDYFKDSYQESSWTNVGHQASALSLDLHVVKQPYEWMQYLYDYFPDLDKLSFCFSRFTPGTYFPMHKDRYAFYSQANQVQDPNDIIRYVLFLEDGAPGHMLQISDTVYHNWPAGLCVGWAYDTFHSAANLGLVDRYTLQITGVQK